MVITEERRIMAIGRSKLITLPPWWLRYHKANAGDKVVVSGRNGELEIRYVKDGRW
jgi:hypothetical protein